MCHDPTTENLANLMVPRHHLPSLPQTRNPSLTFQRWQPLFRHHLHVGKREIAHHFEPPWKPQSFTLHHPHQSRPPPSSSHLVGKLHQFMLEQRKTQPLLRATNVLQSTRANLQRKQQRRQPLQKQRTTATSSFLSAPLLHLFASAPHVVIATSLHLFE